MKHICYFYILGYRSLHNVGINLDARYQYVIDEEEKRIKVYDNPEYIDSLWPRGVASLAAIIGNNGAGKTTSLLYMLEAMANGSAERKPNAIIIYKSDSDRESAFSAYIPKNCGYSIKYKSREINEDKADAERPTMRMFYYSSYFRPCRSIHEPGEGEVDGIYNACDSWKLIKDFQDYSNVDTLHLSETIGFHIDAMRAQDDNRIVMMLRDKELRALLPVNAVPRYILVEPSESGYKRLIHKFQRENIGKVDLVQHRFGFEKEDYLARIVYASFYNYAVETNLKIESVIALQQKWANDYDQTHNVLNSLSFIIDNENIYRPQMFNLQAIVIFLNKACSFNRNTQTLYIDIEKQGSDEYLSELCEYFSMRDFVVAHYFDLGYAREQVATTRLSSGEYDVLKFFSRLYDAAFVCPSRFDNMVCPKLLLIDEAENSYHPEWQRQYVNLLVEFTSALNKRVEKQVREKTYGRQGADSFQIVLTTHSPILLSDIPRICVNYLHKDEESGMVSLAHNQPETFGSNVFELYRNAFFMEKGLIGEYSQRKIIEIQEEIKGKKIPAAEIEKKIRLIGDKGIQAYLEAMLDKYDGSNMLAYYKRKVKELEKNNAAD